MFYIIRIIGNDYRILLKKKKNLTALPNTAFRALIKFLSLQIYKTLVFEPNITKREIPLK